MVKERARAGARPLSNWLRKYRDTVRETLDEVRHVLKGICSCLETGKGGVEEGVTGARQVRSDWKAV